METGNPTNKRMTVTIMDSGMQMILEREIREIWVDFILSLSKGDKQKILNAYSFEKFKEEVWDEISKIHNTPIETL